jgi:uncharacterized protein YfkK (UPF0435 family)
MKNALINEIKLLEPKLDMLKGMVLSGEVKTKSHTLADLYGLLKDSEEITPEDIDAVKIRLKEYKKIGREA